MSLERLILNVVDKNGGKESLENYYMDQGLSQDQLHKDLFNQIPPLNRKQMVYDADEVYKIWENLN